MKDFFTKAAMLTHPLRTLQLFMEREDAAETAKRYQDMRFVGYVLDIGYDTITIITSDPFKVAVGGIPRNSLLIMVPQDHAKLPPHFTLLRVLESAPTPLSKEVQQTYFELQKRSMPELDGVDRIFATLPTILSSRHEGALLPVELAHGVASLSTYPSAHILKVFTDTVGGG
jgi:hypothetical protein